MHAVACGPLAFLVYLRTLWPSISWGDSPELVAAAHTLGVPHPTGYPLYMLIGRLAIAIFPWGDPAYRMNLLSALFSALAIGVLHRLAFRLTGSPFAAWAGALALALAPLFWSQATIAEVYPLAILLQMLLLDQFFAWDQTGRPRHLHLAAALTGVNLAHHLSVGLLAPGLIVLALTSQHARDGLRRLPALVGLMLLPLLSYAYLPIRAAADPWLNWEDIRTPQRFVYHVTGRFYAEMALKAPASAVQERLDELPWLAVGQLGWAGLVLGFLGSFNLLARPIVVLVRALLRRRNLQSSREPDPRAWEEWRLAWLLWMWAALGGFWALHYWVFDYQVFYLPSIMAFSLFVALGTQAAGNLAALLAQRWRPTPLRVWQARALVGSFAVALLAAPVTWRWRANDHAREWSPLRYARAVCQALPQRALLFGFGDYNWFPLIYAHAVEGRRPDVRIFNLYETQRPASYRLFARYRDRDFAVLPVPGFGAPGVLASRYSFLKSLLENNIDRRPVCFLTGPGIIDQGEAAEILAPYYQIRWTNLPLHRYLRQPPALQLDPVASLVPPVGFADGTRLLGFSAGYSESEGVQSLTLRYRWEVTHRTPAEQLRAQVWLTDRQGRFREDAPGEPVLQNTHDLAYGHLPVVLPGAGLTFTEEYRVFVGQSEAGKTYQIRLGLLRGSTAVATDGGREYAVLAEIPIPAAPRPVARH